MDKHPEITDEPLPDGQLVEKANKSEGTDTADTPSTHVEHDESSIIEHLHEALPEPHLHAETSSYGHTDPTSLAAVATLELHNPEFQAVENNNLAAPMWDPATDTVSIASEPVKEAITLPLSQQPSILEHLAQVGLTSSDQWEEQIQPRIQKLHDDIAQVHVQLDELERTKPKKIS